MARRRQTASTEPRTVNSLPTVDRQRSATNRTKARPDGKTRTGSRTPVTVRPKNRQTCCSTYDYRDISAAISRWQCPDTKRLLPRPSPVDSDTATDTEVGVAERDHAHLAQSTCSDDVSRSAMTSPRRLPATTNRMHTQSSTTASPVKSRNSTLAIVTDMGFTPQQFTWLRQVNRCLNPHRRHHWSDKFARVS